MIEQLDIRRAQVHVEALIVELPKAAISTSACSGGQKMPDYAVCQRYANPYWYAGGSDFCAKPQKGSTVISENGATTINPILTAISPRSLSSFLALAVRRWRGERRLDGAGTGGQKRLQSNVLSTPSITTLDNQEAFFMWARTFRY